jgi:hypothetical protein
MFRAKFSPIISNTWLYLQYLVVFTQAAAGWCFEWVGTYNNDDDDDDGDNNNNK